MTEAWALEGWVLDRLREVGVDASLAVRLAATTKIDWHDVERLVKQGCPPDLAARIASPGER